MPCCSPPVSATSVSSLFVSVSALPSLLSPPLFPLPWVAVGGDCPYNRKVSETLPRFEEILDLVASYHPDCDEDLLRSAYVYSAMAHRGQVRVSGEPYLVHPLEVARILAEMHLDEVAIAAGLLHDLIEDTFVSERDLEAQFGPQITNIVKALTKITTMEQSYAAREAVQAENVRRMLLASVEDVRVILVKLADRLHNMRTRPLNIPPRKPAGAKPNSSRLLALSASVAPCLRNAATTTRTALNARKREMYIAATTSSTRMSTRTVVAVIYPTTSV